MNVRFTIESVMSLFISVGEFFILLCIFILFTKTYIFLLSHTCDGRRSSAHNHWLKNAVDRHHVHVTQIKIHYNHVAVTFKVH